MLVTYSRLAPDELYNVSHDGLAGGASRLLVFLNFPTALMAIAVLALVTDRLGARWPALLALVLCILILVPGVGDQNDLDAKWINILPTLGVAIVLTMTLWAVREPRDSPLRGTVPSEGQSLPRDSPSGRRATELAWSSCSYSPPSPCRGSSPSSAST